MLIFCLSEGALSDLTVPFALVISTAPPIIVSPTYPTSFLSPSGETGSWNGRWLRALLHTQAQGYARMYVLVQKTHCAPAIMDRGVSGVVSHTPHPAVGSMDTNVLTRSSGLRVTGTLFVYFSDLLLAGN